MTKDASSSSPGSIVPNTKTASRGRPWSGQDTCAISGTVPPLQAVTRSKLSLRLTAKPPPSRDRRSCAHVRAGRTPR